MADQRLDSLEVFTPKGLGELLAYIEQWFNLGRARRASGGGEGMQFHAGTYGAQNIGDWQHNETTGTDSGSDSPSLAAGPTYSATAATDDDVTTMSLHAVVSGDGTATGLRIISETDGNEDAIGVNVTGVTAVGEVGDTTGVVAIMSSLGDGRSDGGSFRGITEGDGPAHGVGAVGSADGDGNAFGVTARADAFGSGDAVAVSAQATTAGAGACVVYRGYNEIGSVVFEVNGTTGLTSLSLDGGSP